MFEGLKKKLGLGKKKKTEAELPAEAPAADVQAADGSIEAAAQPAAQPWAEEAPAVPDSVPVLQAEEPEEEDDGESSGGVLSKLKSLIVDHKVTLSDKAIDDALTDLQMVLLESDVAYPVTEAIVASMKEELSGSKKKMFSSSEKVVTDALKHAIESVLGTGFDLPAYINSHEKP
ncbi:MAG: signal recognition particle receptor subunit alpha, partial [Methanocorpusculum sp.]|nr:signal recognition particle receptor subunit alpha [Methanocorpusculum sp.]